MKYHILFLGVLTSAVAQQYTTPVPILKQINKHNGDGSYSYGYEAADGTYKIESKYPNGEVFGKYGYIDNIGKLREIEYGASNRGFEPQGNEINVAPPTLNNDKYPAAPLKPGEEDDGQYREDPSIYYKDDKYSQSPPAGYQPAYRHTFDSTLDKNFGPKYTKPSYQQPAYQQPSYPSYQPYQSYEEPEELAYREPAQPAYREPERPAFRPTTKFSFDDFISNRPQPQENFQPSYYTPAPPAYTQNYGASYSQNYGSSYNTPRYNPQSYGSHFAGHPATNVNLDLGSYTVNYKRR